MSNNGLGGIHLYGAQFRKTSKAIAAFAVLALGAACASSTDQVTNAEPVIVQTNPPLEVLPRPLTAGEQRVLAASNNFSFALFRQLNAVQKDSNIFTSPLAVSMALATTLSGASGSTYDQIRGALLLTSIADDDVNTSYASLLALLRTLDASGADIHDASSLWYQNEFAVNQSFIDAGLKSFNTQVSGVDFSMLNAARAINEWAESSTLGKTVSMVDETKAGQSMLLMNAVSFQGTWRLPFDTARTGTAPFRTASGLQTVPMMMQGAVFRYYSSSSFEAADLQFGNGTYSMTIVLPRSGTSIDAVAGAIQEMGDGFWTGRFRDVPMQLYLPRFRIEWDHSLNDDLKALGVRDAFTGGVADFTRMSSRGRELSLDLMKQKTFVSVNEDGTEAAAVLHIPSDAGGVPFPLIMFVNRPFMVIVHERLTGTIIFLGKVMRIV